MQVNFHSATVGGFAAGQGFGKSRGALAVVDVTSEADSPVYDPGTSDEAAE